MLSQEYQLQLGSTKERALLLKFMHHTYQELFPSQKDFSHLAKTVENYFSRDTPLWWVLTKNAQKSTQLNPIACIWMGSAIDQIQGDRYTYIFLLYVSPEHRGRGIARVLMHQAQEWADSRGDHQIGLMVFGSNQRALDLYQSLGYQPQSLLMIKPLI